MIMLIHKICMALRGLGKFINVANEINVSAAILLLGKVVLYSCQQGKVYRFCLLLKNISRDGNLLYISVAKKCTWQLHRNKSIYCVLATGYHKIT